MEGIRRIRIVRAHLLIQGHVQGVGYRAFAEREAKGRALKGWVRNVLEGQVESVVEGDHSTVQDFIAVLKSGPPLARVDSIDVELEEPLAKEHSFQIIY